MSTNVTMPIYSCHAPHVTGVAISSANAASKAILTTRATITDFFIANFVHTNLVQHAAANASPEPKSDACESPTGQDAPIGTSISPIEARPERRAPLQPQAANPSIHATQLRCHVVAIERQTLKKLSIRAHDLDFR